MASNYKRLGNYIQQVDVRNTDLSVELLLGVSIEKKFIDSHANTIGTDFSKYKIVKRGQFAYGPVTSRNGDKVSIALLEDADACLISSSYTPFEIIKPKELNAEYLMMLFRNPEFDRYARYNSWGSAREVFSWDDFCESELYIPSIEEQLKIVRQYNVITNRICVLEKINEELIKTIEASYKELFCNVTETDSLGNICSKIGSGATPSGGKGSYIDSGISLIRSMNVFDYHFDYSDLAHINEKQAAKLSNVIVEENDVLFNITGVSVTRCSIVPNDVLPARVNQHVMIIRPYEGKLMSLYILFTFNSPDYKDELRAIADGGSTRDAITKGDMENLKIPMPGRDLLQRFGKIAIPSFDIVNSNNSEIYKLKSLRQIVTAKI